VAFTARKNKQTDRIKSLTSHNGVTVTVIKVRE